MAMLAAKNVTLDADLSARIDQVASERKRSADAIILEAVTRYVDKEEWELQFNRDTIEALEEFDRSGLHLTNDEVNAWFARLDAGERVLPPECHT